MTKVFPKLRNLQTILHVNRIRRDSKGRNHEKNYRT